VYPRAKISLRLLGVRSSVRAYVSLLEYRHQHSNTNTGTLLAGFVYLSVMSFAFVNERGDVRDFIKMPALPSFLFSYFRITRGEVLGYLSFFIVLLTFLTSAMESKNVSQALGWINIVVLACIVVPVTRIKYTSLLYWIFNFEYIGALRVHRT
jgi:hypothetical protein